MAIAQVCLACNPFAAVDSLREKLCIGRCTFRFEREAREVAHDLLVFVARVFCSWSGRTQCGGIDLFTQLSPPE